jgi:hypothetical protein
LDRMNRMNRIYRMGNVSHGLNTDEEGLQR